MKEDRPMEVNRTITCPSGLKGSIRGLKVREERLLADKRLAKEGRQMDALLSACWQETVDAGPYELRDGALDWGAVLQGDRLFVLLQIRALTYGEDYAFTVECDNSGCRRKIPWTLSLSDLPLRTLPDESRAAFLNDGKLETWLPGIARRATFRLANGEDERQLTKLKESHPERFISSLLATRVVSIEGVTEQDKRRVLEDLPMRDAHHLVAEFERADCGVETGIEVECSKCLNVMHIDLPLDPSFLWPSRKGAGSFPKSV